MLEKAPFFLAVFFLSCLNNLVVPYAIYQRKYGFFKKRPDGFIGVNGWGIVMDGILAGLINITILNLLLEFKLKVNIENVKIALFFGICISIIVHIIMAKRRWKIWIMPSPWHWNSAGYWHMVSMTLQTAFVFYTLILIIKNPELMEQGIIITSFFIIFLLAILFLASLYCYDNKKKLEIGKIKIGNTPW